MPINFSLSDRRTTVAPAVSPFTPQAPPHQNLNPSTLLNHIAAHTPIGEKFFSDGRREDNLVLMLS